MTESSWLCSPVPNCTESFRSHTGRLLKSPNTGGPEPVINISSPASFPKHVKFVSLSCFSDPLAVEYKALLVQLPLSGKDTLPAGFLHM